jgi:GGDEF domain-containing protein
MTGDTVSITVSIGAVSSQALDSFELGLERLFIMADEVMYLSKKQGGNSVVSYK